MVITWLIVAFFADSDVAEYCLNKWGVQYEILCVCLSFIQRLNRYNEQFSPLN